MCKPKVIIIGGPTAVGKTKTSIELAKRFNGEIISADSMQIYAHMNIGSAKPDLVERDGVVHHLMDVVSPKEAFTVANYKTLAEEKIREIHSRGKMSIVVGGTGLYINALLYDMDFSEVRKDHTRRDELQRFVDNEGSAKLHQMLGKFRPRGGGSNSP